MKGNYLAHTQGKRHQRAAREAEDSPTLPQPYKRKVNIRKTVKIGRPGYQVTKQFDPDTKQRSLLFQIEYPEIEGNTKPRCRFMSSCQQYPVLEDASKRISQMKKSTLKIYFIHAENSRFPAQKLTS